MVRFDPSRQHTPIKAPRHLTDIAARQFMRRALLLDQPASSVAEALEHHGFVQIDPINITGRMHDLILRNRVQSYHEGDLMAYLHGRSERLAPDQRGAFEHHLPSTGILVAFPMTAWPYLISANAARSRRAGPWSGRLTPREKAIAKVVFQEITDRGRLRATHFEDDRPASRQVWGKMRLVKSTLQKLFFHGELLIAGRTPDNHRLYDLPQRVLPASVLASPPPTAAEAERWSALSVVRQRRLVLLKRQQLRAIADLVIPIQVAGCPTLHCLTTDLPLFDSPPPAPDNPTILRLLAPLDPLIYDRRVTSAVWGFDYTWEVYTPPAKRVRGYYALPILAGTEIVGHVDPKADRSRRKLLIVARSVRRGHRVRDAVQQLAHWLGLKP